MDADIQPTKKFDFGTHKVYQRKLVIWIWNLDQTGWWKWIFTPFSDGKMLCLVLTIHRFHSKSQVSLKTHLELGSTPGCVRSFQAAGVSKIGVAFIYCRIKSCNVCRYTYILNIYICAYIHITCVYIYIYIHTYYIYIYIYKLHTYYNMYIYIHTIHIYIYIDR